MSQSGWPTTPVLGTAGQGTIRTGFFANNVLIRAFQYIYISNVCNGDELTTVYGQYKAIKKRIRIFNENVIDGRSI
jgi:hypothetical protein